MSPVPGSESLRTAAREAVAGWPVFLSVLSLAYMVGYASHQQDTFATRLKRVEQTAETLSADIADFRAAVREVERTNEQYRGVLTRLATDRNN